MQTKVKTSSPLRINMRKWGTLDKGVNVDNKKFCHCVRAREGLHEGSSYSTTFTDHSEDEMVIDGCQFRLARSISSGEM